MQDFNGAQLTTASTSSSNARRRPSRAVHGGIRRGAFVRPGSSAVARVRQLHPRRFRRRHSDASSSGTSSAVLLRTWPGCVRWSAALVSLVARARQRWGRAQLKATGNCLIPSAVNWWTTSCSAGGPMATPSSSPARACRRPQSKSESESWNCFSRRARFRRDPFGGERGALHAVPAYRLGCEQLPTPQAPCLEGLPACSTRHRQSPALAQWSQTLSEAGLLQVQARGMGNLNRGLLGSSLSLSQTYSRP